jgi:microcystin-dependent protein
MAILIFKNNATSFLAGPITSTSVTAQLAAGTGVLFAQPVANQYFVGTFTDAATGLENEIVYVTNVLGDIITMIRGQEGTTPRAWDANDTFAELWTAGQAATMLQQGQEQAQSTNFAEDTGVANAYRGAYVPPISALTEGMPLRLKILNPNTGPSTFDAGTGPVPIRRRDGSPLIGNELVSGMVAEFFWTGTVMMILDIAPATASAIATGTDTESSITPAQLAAALGSFAGVQSGMVMGFAGGAAPPGWLLCAGQAVSRSIYASLFSTIATTFGPGDGLTTFNLPDYRGRFMAFADGMGGVPANRLGTGATGGIPGPAIVGASGGEQSHVQTVNELVAHTHMGLVASPPSSESIGGTVYTTAPALTGSTGNSAPANITNPVLIINAIIKT